MCLNWGGQEEGGNRPPRFYHLQSGPIAQGQQLELAPEEAKHAARVLRLREGSLLELCDGCGGLTLASIARITRGRVSVVALESTVLVGRAGIASLTPLASQIQSVLLPS
jgi:16S rRNA U1498 N3-methylase RsmE